MRCIKRSLFLSLTLSILLTGCGGPLGKWELEDNTIAEINYGTGENYETVTKDGLVFQIEHSGAHPSISWPVGENRLAALGRNLADIISYGDIDALKGNRYTFVKECESIVKHVDEYAGSREWPATLRVFQLTEMEALYPLRDVDMNGRKFRTYIVVASWLRPTGNYSHWIEQKTNKREEIEYCVDPDNSERPS